MAFLIKDTKLKVRPVEISQATNNYTPLPTQDTVLYDNNALLPIGLLSYGQFDERSNDHILIAMPNVQGIFYGDYPFLTYSLTSDGWRLDEEYVDGLEYKLEENYLDYFQQAHAFFKEHHFLSDDLDSDNKALLFDLGGQPPLGQNWDAMLYDEMGENPELDHYHEIMDEESGADFDDMSTREITYFDEDLEQEFVYLGMFSYDVYFEGGGECIVFYQPDLKKVMVVPEFS